MVYLIVEVTLCGGTTYAMICYENKSLTHQNSLAQMLRVREKERVYNNMYHSIVAMLIRAFVNIS